MKYELHQIQFTDAEIDFINASGRHDATDKSRLDIEMSCGRDTEQLSKFAKEAWNKNYFTHVSNIKTDRGLEGVFHLGNMNTSEAEKQIERLTRMASCSIGDIVVDPQGKKHVVAAFGFAEVQ